MISSSVSLLERGDLRVCRFVIGVTVPDELFAKLEAIYAYDTGATDSGIRDEQLRTRLIAEFDQLAKDEDELRLRLSRWVREAYLSEEALEARYGWEDAMEFLRWIGDGDFRRLR